MRPNEKPCLHYTTALHRAFTKGLFINDIIIFGGYPFQPPPPPVLIHESEYAMKNSVNDYYS